MADEVTIANCPFCGGKAQGLKLPGGFAFGCPGCGCLGPSAMECDGRDVEDRARKEWNKRGGVGNVRIARVAPNVPADTAIVAENLMKAAEKVNELEYGPVDVSLLLLFSSEQKRLGVISHRLDPQGMHALCMEVARGVAQQAQATEQQHVIAPERKLIVPGR